MATLYWLCLNPTGSNVHFERLRSEGGTFLPYPPFMNTFKGILPHSVKSYLVQRKHARLSCCQFGFNSRGRNWFWRIFTYKSIFLTNSFKKIKIFEKVSKKIFFWKFLKCQKKFKMSFTEKCWKNFQKNLFLKIFRLSKKFEMSFTKKCLKEFQKYFFENFWSVKKIEMSFTETC